jgi:hypothetical protein
MVRASIACRGSVVLPVHRELDVREFTHLGSSSYSPRRPESSPALVSATSLCKTSRRVTNLSAHEASAHCVFYCLSNIVSLTNATDKMLSVMQLTVIARPDLQPCPPRVVLMWRTLSRWRCLVAFPALMRDADPARRDHVYLKQSVHSSISRAAEVDTL